MLATIEHDVEVTVEPSIQVGLSTGKSPTGPGFTIAATIRRPPLVRSAA